MSLALLLCTAALAGPMEDLAWMEGTWRGGAEGVVMEETWSAPVAQTMVGTFRFIQDDSALFYEIMVMELEQGVPTMRLKHFDPGLVGWEKRKKAMSFALTAYQADSWAVFVDPAEGKTLRYQRVGDSLTIELVDEGGSQLFELERVVPEAAAAPALPAPETASPTPLLGLRTLGIEVEDLQAAKDFFSRALGVEPYFDQPFYVGFDLNGSELGLSPRDGQDGSGPGGVSYWRVDDIQAVRDRLIREGATEHQPVQDVGGGVQVAVIATPQGCLLGLIQEAPAD